MCELTPVEEAILVNLTNKTKGVVANQLSITVTTLEVHLTRIRRKRAKCKEFLRKTDQYRKEIYPKRKGE